MSTMEARLKELGANAVDVSKVVRAPDGPGGGGSAQGNSPQDDVKLRRAAGF